MDLEELGWDEHFQAQIDSLGFEDIIPGRVFRTSPSGQCELYTKNGELTARIPGRLKKQASTGAELPGVGDWVLVKPLEIGNMIFKVLTRKNQISRKVAGKKVSEQLVAANIDIMFMVMGLDDDFNLSRMERFIFMVTVSGAIPVVILNKADLVTDAKEKEKKIMKIVGDKIEVNTICALDKTDINIIRKYLKKGVTITLVGSSGVGKSTIINTLIGQEKQRTADVREKDSKGRHITKTRELFMIPGGGVMIDNPGIREVQLWGDPGSIQDVFSDIEELSYGCKFKDCAHLNEPKCAVISALEAGELSQKRYDNYQKMKAELAHLNQKMKMSSEALEKAKWKGVMKNAKYYQRYKREQG